MFVKTLSIGESLGIRITISASATVNVYLVDQFTISSYPRIRISAYQSTCIFHQTKLTRPPPTETGNSNPEVEIGFMEFQTAFNTLLMICYVSLKWEIESNF